LQPLSTELRRFLTQHIRSVEEAEVLVLLAQTKETWWKPAEVGVRLHLDAGTARSCLELLSGRFLEVRMAGDTCFRFAPGHPEREALIEEMGKAYRKSRTEVLGAIASGRTLQDFADAFKLKREED
jgi:hypothetical protein